MSSSPSPRFRSRLLVPVAGFYLAATGYLAAESSPDLFYVGNVFFHHFGGLVLALATLALAGPILRRLRRERSPAFAPALLATVLGTASVVAALVLADRHHTRETRDILVIHVVLALLAMAALLVALAWRARSRPGSGAGRIVRVVGSGALAGLVLAGGLPLLRNATGRDAGRIENPLRPPFTMAEESMGGADGPFFPSSASTSTDGTVPSEFFLSSEACRRCHEDIYETWESSAHHFSSFNNQWYRKSIEYMQEVAGIEASKWCAGCHDHAVLFPGTMDDPVESFVHTEEAQAGLGCNSCHAITSVRHTMGNGGFEIEYPALHDLAASEHPLLRWLHDTAVRLDPGPHRDTFLKPFHREQRSEFCASCHKVHLDEPVNSYRWIRGFNEYDNWQASGVSGQGARSFYYPPEPLDCADCHMPRIPSEDDGRIDGQVHDHSFAAANTALPTANLDAEQFERVARFLQNQQVTVDVFAIAPGSRGGPGETGPVAEAASPETRLATTFAVGEEAAMTVGSGRGGRREAEEVWAPLDRADVGVRPGDDLRVDVVVRTRGVGHFFPGGTVDAFDVWLELRAVDETGRVLYWSGVATDGGRGPVDPGAHFYGARMVDGRGNPIDKRNAFATRAVAWVNLIPPGAADVARFRFRVPEDCGETISFEARLNYRKFTVDNTRFAFAGRPAPGEPSGPGPGIDRVTPHWDDREFVIGEVAADVSAARREIPDLPILVLDRGFAEIAVAGEGSPGPRGPRSNDEADALRWNDYGIGLFRQGDLPGAERAFRRVTELDPAYADGFVNLARVAIREGRLEPAVEALGKARALDPELPKIRYFLGVAAKEQGRYDEALEHFRTASSRYPRDRVVLNAIGRVLFLQRRYGEAVSVLERVLAIDPEDLSAHYNLMLAHRGLGNVDEAEAERRLYERFKADEQADEILGPYLRDHPEDNRMRQPIHEQVSAPRELIDRETAHRARDGEPLVVLPGGSADFAAKLRRLAEETP